MKPETQQLTLREGAALAVQSPDPLMSVLQSIAGSERITPESVEVAERVLAMMERQRKAEAEQGFARAFAALQAETPSIKAQKEIPDKQGNIKYTYAPFDAIMREVRPLLTKHGFAVTFDTEFADGRTVVTCTLMHTSGHSRANKFSARVHAPPQCSDAQADGSTVTYAKRYALCAALNIVIGDDNDGADARHTAAPIDPQTAADLEIECEELSIDKAKFLKWLGVTRFEDIPEDRMTDVRAQIERKRKEAK